MTWFLTLIISLGPTMWLGIVCQLRPAGIHSLWSWDTGLIVWLHWDCCSLPESHCSCNPFSVLGSLAFLQHVFGRKEICCDIMVLPLTSEYASSFIALRQSCHKSYDLAPLPAMSVYRLGNAVGLFLQMHNPSNGYPAFHDLDKGRVWRVVTAILVGN